MQLLNHLQGMLRADPPHGTLHSQDLHQALSNTPGAHTDFTVSAWHVQRLREPAK